MLATVFPGFTHMQYLFLLLVCCCSVAYVLLHLMMGLQGIFVLSHPGQLYGLHDAPFGRKADSRQAVQRLRVCLQMQFVEDLPQPLYKSLDRVVNTVRQPRL